MIGSKTKCIACATVGYLLALVSGNTTCNQNSNMWKSIQYQLKLVEESNWKCDCGQKDLEKVAFMAYNSKVLQNAPKGSVVIYDEVYINSGNGYNPSTGIFTAPSDGLYYFSWTSKTATPKYFMTHLALNGIPIAKSYTTAQTINNDLSTSSSAIAAMKKGDTVCVKVDHGDEKVALLDTNKWSNFNGFKL